MEREHRRLLVLAAALGLLTAHPAVAQNGPFTLAVSGGPLVFTAPTAADFSAGFALHPTGLTFSVDLANNAHPSNFYQSTVSIRGTTATLGANGKPLSHLEWSLGAGGPWQPLSVTDTQVESRAMRRNRNNDPWGNTLQFRMRLAWTADAPATYSTGIVVTLTVTGP